MRLYRGFPTPSDRMGALWALSGVEDAFIIEFGPAGTTHFAIEGFMQFDCDMHGHTYTTHMDESDITFGEETRLVNAVKEIDAKYKPKYIFLSGSSISAIIGIDLTSVIFGLQEEVQAKLIALPDCDFTSSHRKGIANITKLLVKEVVQPAKETKPLTYNLMGLNVCDYNWRSDHQEIKRMLAERLNLNLITSFTMDTTIEAVETSAQAAVNVVLHPSVEPAAKLMKKKYGVPYVMGRPYGLEQTEQLLEDLAQALDTLLLDGDATDNQLAQYAESAISRRLKQGGVRRIWLKDFMGSVPGLAGYLTDLGFDVVESDHAPDTYDMLLGDQVTAEQLERSGADVQSIQVSYPSHGQMNRFIHTPYMGIRGVAYLSQALYNAMKK